LIYGGRIGRDAVGKISLALSKMLGDPGKGSSSQS
jgi:hypothetical protein